MYTIWCHTHAASRFPQKRTQNDTCTYIDSNLEVIYFSHEDPFCLLCIRPMPWKLGEWPCHGFPNYKHIGGCHFPLQRKRRRRRRKRRRRRRRRAPSWRRYLHTPPTPPAYNDERRNIWVGAARPPAQTEKGGRMGAPNSSSLILVLSFFWVPLTNSSGQLLPRKGRGTQRWQRGLFSEDE